MITLQSIARVLGGTVTGQQVLAPGPGHSKHDRSLAVFIHPHSPGLFWVHSHAGDDWKDCRDYVKARLGISDRRRQPTWAAAENAPPKPTSGDPDRKATALTVWHEAVAPAGTALAAYLSNRGLSLAAGLESGDVLRFHPACPFRLENGDMVRLPTMVSLFRDIITDEPGGIHRTALRPDGGGKADVPGLGSAKKMLGAAGGCAIKISPDSEVTQGLGIAEGIETTLTAYCAGWRPMWAMGSAGAIAKFSAVAGVEALTIFGDGDETGVKAAKECLARWADVRKECTIILPPADGMDWNDMARVA